MTKLQEVKAKIIEAVPEIMEPVYGCEVHYPKDSPYKLKVCSRTLDVKDGVQFTYSIDIITAFELKTVRPDDVEILGRPIRLLDCAKALNRDITELIKLWNDEDDLDRQSEACIELLYSKLFT